MLFLKNFKTLNSEWLRQPFSQLEFTLRFPYLARYVVEVFFKRLFLFWLLIALVLYKLTLILFLSLFLGFFMALIYELLVLRNRYQKSILPQHLANLKTINLLYVQKNNFSNQELIQMIQTSVKLSAWGLIHIGYVGIAAYGWEYVFKWLYPWLVKTREFNYHQLLVGFDNKTTEADQKLWEVAQIKDKLIQKKQLEKYLDGYGSRVEDVDLSLPTFREQTQAINKLLSLHSQLPAPASTVKNSKSKKELATQKVLKNLRIAKSIFTWLLTMTQQNVNLREDRRFYEFLADYQIRQMIFLLAKRLKIEKQDIFNKSWKELTHAVN